MGKYRPLFFRVVRMGVGIGCNLVGHTVWVQGCTPVKFSHVVVSMQLQCLRSFIRSSGQLQV